MRIANIWIVTVLVVFFTSCGTSKDRDGYFDFNTLLNEIKHRNAVIEKEIDKINYKRLAGIYISSNPSHFYSNISSFRKGTFSWGNDYQIGRYAIYIDYTNGKWSKTSNGEIDYFIISNSKNDSVEIDRGEGIDPRKTWLKFNGKIIESDVDEPYTKISGPDNQSYLFRDIIRKKQNDQKKYLRKIVDPNKSRTIIEQEAHYIYDCIISRNLDEVIKHISKYEGIQFGLEKNAERLNKQTELSEIQETLLVDSNLLCTTRFTINEEYYNQFRYLNEKEIIDTFGKSITVEMWDSIYSMYTMIFKEYDNEYYLVALVNEIEIE